MLALELRTKAEQLRDEELDRPYALANEDHAKDQEEHRHDRRVVLIEPVLPSVEHLVRPGAEEDRRDDRFRHTDDGDGDVQGYRCDLLATRQIRRGDRCRRCEPHNDVLGVDCAQDCPDTQGSGRSERGIPPIHLGIEPSSLDLGLLLNFRTAATTR